ncbi:MAG: acyl-CoA dehydrogenase [Chitinophagia bacterium]|nr:acyl-CoA dehydrogenase [Chitinophagia bacterium]
MKGITDAFATERLRAAHPRYLSFLTEELLPIEGQLLSMPFHEAAQMLEEKRVKARALGLWAPYLPESEGCLGLGMTEFAQVSELMAMTPFGHYVFNCQAPDIGNIELLHRHADARQQALFLAPLMEGRIRSCFGMTEPGHAGSNPVVMSTRAEIEGDEWVIDGTKWFTTGADGAAFVVVMAVTDPDAARHERASLVIVPTDTPGYRRVRNIPVMGESGEGHVSHSEIRFEGCRVPAGNLLGPRGAGFRLAQERLGPGRIHHCMRWVGISERAFDIMCRRAVSRDMGDGQRLSDKQSLQHAIAESRASIDAARYMVLHAADALDRRGAGAARHEISAIKFFVADVMLKVLDRAIQACGAMGLTDETPLSWWYRHERGARIYDGPDEVHKSSLARSILRGYAGNQSPDSKP